MPALCSMFSGTYYAQNYASIIGGSLLENKGTAMYNFAYIQNTCTSSIKPSHKRYGIYFSMCTECVSHTALNVPFIVHVKIFLEWILKC